MIPTKDAIAGAQAAEVKWRIPASITLAQWALESNWGKSTPPGSNNPFGIKALSGQPYVIALTREVIHGQGVMVHAAFRKFASLAEAFDDHGRLLATAPVYAPARAKLPDPDGFARALTGVYATDPNYGAALCHLMEVDGFYAYNGQAAGVNGQPTADALMERELRGN